MRPALDAVDASPEPVVESVAVQAGAPPDESPRALEEALELTRAERKLVQRGLAALEFDVGVADGMFGRRTRAAIAVYQKSKGLDDSGYLDAETARTLLAVGEEVAAGDDGPSKDSEEAERLEVERLAAEREFWASVKDSEDSQQFNAYLEAYPNGLYEKLARQRRDTLLEAQDDAAFQRAESLGTAEAFGEYLREYPSGRHADNARNRQLALQAKSEVAEANVAADGAQLVPEWEPGTVFQDCPECPEMVVLPPSTSGLIAVGRYEVTFSEWDACHKAGGCSHDPPDRGLGRGRRPVVHVNWDDTQEYVRWLSKVTGETYRLLRGVEWDFASAGAKTRRSILFSFGGKKIQTVGSSPPNVHGLYDMDRNVWEWTRSCWNSRDEEPTSSGSVKTRSETCDFRVPRGGDVRGLDVRQYEYGGGYRLPPRVRSAEIGFRVVRTLD